MEAAATGVCTGSLQLVLATCLQDSLFLDGVSTGNHLFLPAGSHTSLEGAFYAGWQPCDTYRNQLRLQSTLVGFKQELRYISTSV